jgi:hypothetical protein
MTTTLRVILPPRLLAVLVVALVVVLGGLVLGGAAAVEGLAVLGGAVVEGGSTTTVRVTVAGSSDTVVVGLLPLSAPGADVVEVIVTGPAPVPATAVALLLVLGFGDDDIVAEAAFDVELPPGNGATVTCGPLDPTALDGDKEDDAAEEDDEPAEVTVVGGAATPVPQPAVSTIAAATMTRRCRACIRPRCHAGRPTQGRLGRSSAPIAA